jgi:cytochrome c biogenesis protein
VDGLAGAERRTTVRVNHPLRLPDANVHLLGHGYAPIVRYTDRYGGAQTVFAPFLPSDEMLTSDGVIAFPDANVDPTGATPRDRMAQVAFAGVYMPTVPDDVAIGSSAFPAERDPSLMLNAYQGNLGLDSGLPQNVYTLDQRQIDSGQLRLVGDPHGHRLRPGESWTLPDGSTVEFLGTRQWVSLSIRHDPGEPIVLAGAAALLLGLVTSLLGRRRRIWARVTPDGEGRSLVSLGGLARTDYPGFGEEFARVTALCAAPAAGAPTAPGPTAGGPAGVGPDHDDDEAPRPAAVGKEQ